MFKLRAILLFSSVVAISGGFLSDEVKQIDFRKVHDGSKELNFEWVNLIRSFWEFYLELCTVDFRYQLDDGSTFNGTAYLLNINEAHTYILIGANDDIYWVKFTDSEFRNATELRKMVRSGWLHITNSQWYHNWLNELSNILVFQFWKLMTQCSS